MQNFFNISIPVLKTILASFSATSSLRFAPQTTFSKPPANLFHFVLLV
jgi:hypothetical protein